MQDPQVRLTEEERRRLDELEAAFRAEDPRLARRLKCARRVPLIGMVLSASPPARGGIGILLIVIGAIVTVATFTVWLPVAIAATLVMTLGGYLALTASSMRDRFHRVEARLRRDTPSPDH